MMHQFISGLLVGARLHKFAADEGGTTAIEYGLMTALISLVIIGAVNSTGQAINNVLFGHIVTALATMSK
jgi:pilus assembly protein Flp/PilA